MKGLYAVKKVISILSATVIFFSALTCTVGAASEKNFAAQKAVEEQSKTWEDYDEAAEMYICATADSLSGHVWLYFKNITDCDIPIGYTTLGAGEEISVGSLRNTRKDGGGTYYNGEGMMASKNPDKICEHTYSLKMTVTPAQLKKVNEKICKMNSYDLIFNNCGVFATVIWNSVSEKKVIHIVFPALTILSMITLKAQKGELNMRAAAELNKAFKQKKGECVPVKDINSLINSSCIG